jgi:DNA replication initiation complex subunit (GINS family)
MDTTTQQLKKQQQELVNSLTQIIKDSNIPINDKLPIIKELSRAIANIAEQVNKMTGDTPAKERSEGKDSRTTQGRNQADKEGEGGDAAPNNTRESRDSKVEDG